MTIKIDKQTISDSSLSLHIIVPAKDLSQFTEQACLLLAYREGLNPDANHNPRDLVAEKIGEELVDELTSEIVMSMTAPFARSQIDDMSTVGAPAFSLDGVLQIDEDFSYQAVWVLMPTIELCSYDPVEIDETETDVQHAEELKQRIKQMIDAYATYESIDKDGPVEKGDIVSLSLVTVKNGVRVEGLCFEDRPYVTGSATMPPDFERQIIGMRPGESNNFAFEGPVEFDKDEQPILESYVTTAVVNHFIERKVPELTDAWVAANIPGCSNVMQLNERLGNDLERDDKKRRRHQLNYLSSSALAERFSGHIPDVAYEAMQSEILAGEQADARQAGMTVEELRQHRGIDKRSAGMVTLLQARERLVQSMALDALVRHLNMKVEDCDLDEFFEASASEGQAMNMRHQFEVSGQMYLAREGALRLKANDWLTKHASVRKTS